MNPFSNFTLGVAMLAAFAPAQAATLGGPLTLEDEGAFFVNGKTVTSNFPGASLLTGPSAPGKITVNQMYVHYRIPVAKHGAPVVMVHGSNHTGMTYETTPDGREGWATYFARKGAPVYVVDHAGRGRSGFDPTPFNQARDQSGANPASLPTLLLATHERHVRNMPGRIVGETVDARGRRGYVLTLATREQHIRRERATSNICTNQGLCALAVTAYLSLLGRHGLRSLAETNYQAAHAVATRLDAAGAPRVFAAPFFNEFAVHAPDAAAEWEALARDGVVAGFPLGRWYPELDGALLVCVTETHGAEHVDRLVGALAAPAPAVRSVRG